jgi:hypothetical protein
MRILPILIGFTLASQVNAADSVRVDDVPIQGGLHDLSVSDLHEAIVAFTQTMSKKPSALEVISSSEIHAYKSQDLGWMTMRRMPHVYPSRSMFVQWTVIGRFIWDVPEALHVLGSAEEVYVFPVTTPREPHLPKGHLRLLGPAARKQLQNILSDQRNWFHGFDNLIMPDDPRTDVGFLFRQGKSELVLFMFYHRAQGTFNGENTGGSLDLKTAWKDVEEWKRQYAQAELAAP